MTGFLSKAVEHTVCTQGDKNQPNAVLCQLCRAVFAVGGAGQQGQLLVRNLQDIHQRQGSFHLCNRFFLAVPKVGAVVGVVGDDCPQLFGAGGGVQRGGAGGVGGQTDRAEMHDFGCFQGFLRNVLFAQHHISVGTAVKAEIPLTGGIHRNNGHGGGVVGIGDHIAGVYLVFLQNLGQIAAKGILAHLADKGSLCAQLGGGNRQVGGGAAGVCRKLRNAAFIPAGLGQVDQNFTNRYNIHVYLSLLNVSNKKKQLYYFKR